MKAWIPLACLAAAPMVVAVANLGTQDDAPPVFSAKTLAEAKAVVKGTEKFLVVKATAVWCAPCKAMNKTTWRDAKVEGWFKENGLAIELDVDKAADDAKALRIMAMPTMVAFKGENEVDRIVGYKDADTLMKWLDGLKQGKQHDDELQQKVKDAKEGKATLTAKERLDLARELAQSGRSEAAADEYAWLWDNLVKQAPAMVGVRGSFMVNDMQGVASRSDKAKATFAAMRDALAEKLKQNPAGTSPEDLAVRDDWVLLNKVVGDEKTTLAWVDTAMNDEKQAPYFVRYGYTVRELLIQNERWAQLGKIIKDPLQQVQTEVEMDQMAAKHLPVGIEKEMREMMLKVQADSLRRNCGKIYAAMLASKRMDEAKAVYAAAVKADGSPEMKATLEEFAAKVK